MNLFFIILLFTFCVILEGILIPFTIFHFWMICSGKTTIEYCEKNSTKVSNYFFTIL